MGYAKKPGRRAVAKFSWRREVYEAEMSFVKRRNTLRSRTSQSGASLKRLAHLEVLPPGSPWESQVLRKIAFVQQSNQKWRAAAPPAGLLPDGAAIMIEHYSGRSPPGAIAPSSALDCEIAMELRRLGYSDCGSAGAVSSVRHKGPWAEDAGPWR